jgi:hypothetical protein
MTWAENERVHDLRLAMWEWRMDPVGGRTRLIKDIMREHGATDHEMTHACLRVSAGLRPNALAYQDLDAYAAAWRDALVKELRAYKAAARPITALVWYSTHSSAAAMRRAFSG